MTGVSDLPFRQTASALAAPYVATEMVACDSFVAAARMWCAAPRWVA